jgi:hypothetical protein
MRLALKVVMQNDGDFVDVILLYTWFLSECYYSPLKEQNTKKKHRGELVIYTLLNCCLEW